MSSFAAEQSISTPVGDIVGRSLEGVLQNLGVERHLLQDFRTLALSLGWQLSDLFWSTAGVAPFVENEVPFVVTSNGGLSQDAAAVLLAGCLEAPPEGEIVVMELGAGSGLFARYFLESFRSLSAQAGVDFFDRLRYIVSDRSRRTVEQWREKRLFAEFGNHVVIGTCDAVDPSGFQTLDGWPIPAGPFRAMFFNYALDVLPAGVVRQGASGIEQLAVRTSMVDDDKLLRQYTRMTPVEIQEIARSNDPARLPELLPLVSLFTTDTRFLPVDGAAPAYAEASLSFAPGISRTIVNHGAIDALEAGLRLLAPDGFLLVNDYGSVRTDQITEDAGVQRFGRSTALGLNFPFLDHHFREQGYTVLQAEGDAERPIHARIFAHRSLPAAAEKFATLFSFESFEGRDHMVVLAREHRTAGRSFQAVQAYQMAAQQRSHDWHLLGEVADYVGLHLRDFAAGVEIARAAVVLNPWYSTFLWNVLGDCLFWMGDYEGAHEAHMQAYRINPRDTRTNLNLAFTLFELGASGAALNAIAAALASDGEGKYRDALLQKQQHILSAVTSRWQGEQERGSRGVRTPDSLRESPSPDLTP